MDTPKSIVATIITVPTTTGSRNDTSDMTSMYPRTDPQLLRLMYDVMPQTQHSNNTELELYSNYTVYVYRAVLTPQVTSHMPVSNVTLQEEE